MEKLSAEIFTDDINSLVLELNANKKKFKLFTIDRIGNNHYRIQLENDDSAKERKLFGVLNALVKRTGKGKVESS